ncbi:MAG: FHA domain-containing protein, partial [Aggregatilineales bacterium]
MIIRCTYNEIEHEFNFPSNTVLLGRRVKTTDNELDLKPDKHVSRRHARILYRNDVYLIEDLGSRHGTYVNGEQLIPNERKRINADDKIQIGNTLVQIVLDEPGSPIDAVPTITELISVLSAQQTASDLILPTDERDVEALKIARRHLGVLYAMSALPGTVHNIEELQQAVLDYIAEAIPKAHTLGLIRQHYDDGTLALVASKTHTGDNPRYSESQPLTVMEKRQSAIWSISDGDMSKSAIEHNIQSAMYAPLIWDDTARGALFVNSTSPAVVFSDDDLRLLTALANQAAILMRNQELQEIIKQEEVIRANLLRHFS